MDYMLRLVNGEAEPYRLEALPVPDFNVTVSIIADRILGITYVFLRIYNQLITDPRLGQSLRHQLCLWSMRYTAVITSLYVSSNICTHLNYCLRTIALF